MFFNVLSPDYAGYVDCFKETQTTLLSSPDKFIENEKQLISNPNIASKNYKPSFLCDLDDYFYVEKAKDRCAESSALDISIKNFINPNFQQSTSHVNENPCIVSTLFEQIHSINSKIMRVFLVTCTNYDALLSCIQNSFNSLDMVTRNIITFDGSKVLAIGWYDVRQVLPHIEYLNNIALSCNIHSLSFSYITDQLTFEKIISFPIFKFLEDIYDTLYLYVNFSTDLTQKNINLVKLQNEVYLELLKFGSVYQISLINENYNCYQCRFHNIRTPFLIQKMKYIRIADLKVSVHQTLIEIYENFNKNLACQDDNSMKNIKPEELKPLIPCNLLPDEWRKYELLKRRRLGSLPFTDCKIPNENKIYICKIFTGEDKRTTLMIRNIPNKVKHEDIKNFVDKTCYGRYEFLYLRIDFENKCNVGYAFISFKNPLSIIPFYQKQHGKKWPNFKSEKICQLAYANVQGIDNLIQKFKCSKVLTGNPEYRPRIYYTEGKLKGQEKDFPLQL